MGDLKFPFPMGSKMDLTLLEMWRASCLPQDVKICEIRVVRFS